jgi:hypothetical protein
VCHLPKSRSAVISLLSVCTIYILHVIKCMHIQHKEDLREIGWDGVDWIDMTQDRDQ